MRTLQKSGCFETHSIGAAQTAPAPVFSESQCISSRYHGLNLP